MLSSADIQFVWQLTEMLSSLENDLFVTVLTGGET